jgi:hypothetical protein
MKKRSNTAVRKNTKKCTESKLIYLSSPFTPPPNVPHFIFSIAFIFNFISAQLFAPVKFADAAQTQTWINT